MGILQESYSLSKEQIDFYQQNKYIKLKQVFDQKTISHFNKVITDQVASMRTEDIPLDQRNTYGKAFLQLFNLWTLNEAVRSFVCCTRLAKIAAELMQVSGVRMYHDQALFKEAGGGITPWHADQYYWPLHSDNTITAWIPLQETPLEMGPLEFSAGSHVIQEGRDLSIGDESEQAIGQRLRVTDFEHVIEAFDLGEVSFHSGWVFHRAGANKTQHMRKVMTVIYMEEDMKLKAPENPGQLNDWNTWCPGAKLDAVIETELNPVLFSNK